MANYHYDEAGNMAAYFLLTFLALVLIPATFFALSPSSKYLFKLETSLPRDTLPLFQKSLWKGVSADHA